MLAGNNDLEPEPMQWFDIIFYLILIIQKFQRLLPSRGAGHPPAELP